MKIILLLFIFIFSFSCKTQTINQENISTDKKHVTLMDNEFTAVYNSNKTLILFYKLEQSRNDPAKHFIYYVQRVSDKSKIYEGMYRGENIEWHDNNSLAMTPYIGIIQKPDNSILNGSPEVEDSNNKQILKIN